MAEIAKDDYIRIFVIANYASILFCRKLNQVAQLSQRDRAAG